MRLRMRPERAQLTPGEPFTPDTLRSALKTKVIPPQRLAVPDDASLVNLCRILAFWKNHYLEHQNWHLPLCGERRRAVAALEAAAEALELVDRRYKESVIAIGELALSGPMVVERVKDFNDIGEALRSLKSFTVLAPLQQTSALVESWTFVGDALGQDFVEAMKSTNPGFSPGIGHAGPVSRFLAAVAPAITGELPPVGSVSTTLKRQTRKRGI